MIYLTKGTLPWHNMKGGKDRIEKYNLITDKKMNTSIESLCSNLPSKLSMNNSFKLNMLCFITIVVVWSLHRPLITGTYDAY
jgi:hypothetical protein